MPPAADHVLVQLTIDSVGLARQGFGEMLILSHRRSKFPERVRRYTSTASGVADWGADSVEGRAIAAAFAQNPKPRTVAVGLASGTLTQRYDLVPDAPAVGEVYSIDVKGEGVTDTTVSYTALADLTFVDADVTVGSDTIAEAAHGMLTGAGPFRLSTTGALPAATPSLAVDTNYWIIAADADHYKLAISKANALAGTAVDLTAAAGGGTHTLRRVQHDVVCAQLVQGLSAVTGANYTATQVTGAGETDSVRVIANTANGWFSLATNNPFTLSNNQTHAAPSDTTLATDLAAILLADQGWYTVVTLYNSDAYVAAVEAWTESNARTYAWDTCNTACGTTVLAGGTDIGATSLGLNYARSMGCYYREPARFLAIAQMGRWLPTDPGKATNKFKTLAAITGETLTDTFKFNLRARRMNAYEQVLPDRAFFWEGSVFSNTNKFFDVTRNADWYQDQAQKAVLEALAGVDIDPFTQPGIDLLEAELIGVGDLAFRQGVLAAIPVTEAPAIADVSSTDKANRNLSGLKQSGTFAGAIHTVDPVNVVLTF